MRPTYSENTLDAIIHRLAALAAPQVTQRKRVTERLRQRQHLQQQRHHQEDADRVRLPQAGRGPLRAWFLVPKSVR